MSLVRYALYAAGGIAAFYVIDRLFMGTSVPPPTCSTEFLADRHGGQRSMSSVRLVVLHSTDPGSAVANPTAKSTAEYFSSTDVAASTQLVIGEDGCFRTLPDDVVPYGAGSPANERGLHVEQAGQSFWTRAQWLARDATLRMTGGAVAQWCRMYDIPCVFRTAEDLVALSDAGWPEAMGGITTHAEVSRAWHATDHTDPGVGYPIDVLMQYAGCEG